MPDNCKCDYSKSAGITLSKGICPKCGKKVVFKEMPDRVGEILKDMAFKYKPEGEELDYFDNITIRKARTELLKVVESLKKNDCDHPDPETRERCGGCFPCSYDQTIDEVAKLFAPKS